MKSIDKLVLKAFLGPFLITQAVVVFILLVQNLLEYLKDLMGKDLGFGVFLELVFYFGLNLVPVALPLAILISSLISFGNLGEHYELTAIKSAGISLIRVLIPVFLFVVAMCFLSYWFNDQIVPRANLKAYSLLYDIKQKKPAMELKEGVFYDGIPNYNIKVNFKYPDGKHLKGLIIYDHNKGLGNSDVILADSGKMYTIHNNRYLVFELFNGISYHSQFTNDANQTSTSGEQFVRNVFKQSKMIFSLESFDLQRTDEQLFSSHKIMRTSKQLSKDIDSLSKMRQDMNTKAIQFIAPYYTLQLRDRVVDSIAKSRLFTQWQDTAYFKKIWQDPTYIKPIIAMAASNSKNLKTIVQSRSDIYKNIKKEVITFEIEKQRKLSHAFACLIMFMIGAPLGAIIKKGGLGVPILISIIFFIIFYIFSMTGEKWAKESFAPVFVGMWGGNFILFFIGIFFLFQARNDSRLLEADAYLVIFSKLIEKFRKKEKNVVSQTIKA